MAGPFFPTRLLSLPLFGLLCLLFSSFISVRAEDDEPTSTPAQVSTPFIEPATGLPMERFFGARSTFGFAMAMPTNPVSSFIGQMSFPLVAGAGWGAIGLTGEMENNFFLSAWADGAGGVMASFRQGTNEDNPPEVVGKFAVKSIAEGTAVNSTFMTFTFLCEGCLDAALGLGAASTAADGVMGWALSEKAVTPPGNPAATLGFHERGFGPFTMRLALAKNAAFDAVAATAGQPVGASANAKPVTLNAVNGAGGGGDDDNEGGDDGEVEDDD